MDILELSGQGIADPTGNTGNVLHGPDAHPNPGFGSWFDPDFFYPAVYFLSGKKKNQWIPKPCGIFKTKLEI